MFNCCITERELEGEGEGEEEGEAHRNWAVEYNFEFLEDFRSHQLSLPWTQLFKRERSGNN